MKIILEESDKIYQKIYRIGRRLVKSFNDHVKDLKVSAIAYGLPYDDPTLVTIKFFNKEFPADKMYIWESGTKTLDDYNLMQEYSAGSRADHINYLTTTNNGILAMHHNEQYILCTEHNDEDLNKTEETLFKSLKTLKESKAIGSK
jgi:glutamate-1-semialdehyde aminotransferase